VKRPVSLVLDVAWRIIDGLRIRYATNGRGGEKVGREQVRP
jgi:hypothetical protein